MIVQKRNDCGPAGARFIHFQIRDNLGFPLHPKSCIIQKLNDSGPAGVRFIHFQIPNNSQLPQHPKSSIIQKLNDSGPAGVRFIHFWVPSRLASALAGLPLSTRSKTAADSTERCGLAVWTLDNKVSAKTESIASSLPCQQPSTSRAAPSSKTLCCCGNENR